MCVYICITPPVAVAEIHHLGIFVTFKKNIYIVWFCRVISFYMDYLRNDIHNLM